MRILLIGTSYPMRGGMAHYMASLYQKLVERGHEATVISFKRQYPSPFFPGKTQQDLSGEGFVVPSEPLLDSICPLSWIRAFERIRQARAEIVLFNYWMPFFLPCYATVALLTRLFTETSVVFLCHNIIPHEARPGDRILTWIGLKTVDFFIVQAEPVRRDLLRFRPNASSTLVPHPVYDVFATSLTRAESRSQLGLGGDERVLLFFGYVRHYKGLHVLLDALAILKQTTPARLLVAGEFYEDEGETRDEIQRLELTEDVLVFNQYIPNEAVGVYFSAADIVVLPYLTATQSGILQIAYNFDRPVIVTDVGGLAESVDQGRTGYVVPPGDPRAMASAIQRFLREQEETDFAANVAAYKRRFSWDRLAEAIEGLAGNERRR